MQLDLIPKAMHVGSRGIDQEICLGPDFRKERMFLGEGVGQQKPLAREGVGPARFSEAAMKRRRLRIQIKDFNGEGGVGLAKKVQPRREALEFAGEAPSVDGDREVPRALLCFRLGEKGLEEAGRQIIDAVKAKILEGPEGDRFPRARTTAEDQ
jgi:hypothetical protein